MRQQSQTRNFNTSAAGFHSELIDSILGGFVDINANLRNSVEAMLRSIGQTAEESQLTESRELVMIEKFEWNATIRLLRSGRDFP